MSARAWPRWAAGHDLYTGEAVLLHLAPPRFVARILAADALDAAAAAGRDVVALDDPLAPRFALADFCWIDTPPCFLGVTWPALLAEAMAAMRGWRKQEGG